MSDNQTENLKIREYLLGKFTSIDEEFEEKLMTDDQLFKKYLIEEEELIQDYVDGELEQSDKKRFEEFFLISKERQEKVKFARSLRDHFEQESIKLLTDSESEKKPKPRNFFSTFFSTPIPVAICFLIIAGLSGFFIWNNFLSESENEIALLSLNKAFKNERPLESRITGFEYAPKSDTRGNEETSVNKLELENAELLVRKNVRENPNAENLHALGRIYLAKREFDRAIEELEKAEKLNEKDAQIQNDLGVAYLGKESLSDDNAEKVDLADRSLSKFDKAIELDPNLLEALFNKAITLQNNSLSEDAKKIWEEYLKLDSSSKWADEARKNLQDLKTNTSSNLDAKGLEDKFIEAYKSDDEDKAFNLISQNREIISQKYLPQRLAKSFVNANESDKAKYLEALEYLGKIEKKKIQDNFASDLGVYYKNITPTQIEILKKANNSMQKGYVNLLESAFDDGLKNFSTARDHFIEADNDLEANTISAILIVYCLDRSNKKKEALTILDNVNSYTKKNKYVWLNLLNAYWLIGVESFLGKKNYIESKIDTEQNLRIAKEIGDSLMIQAFLLSLASKSNFVNNQNDTKSYLKELFYYSGLPNNSLRQKIRNYGIGTEILVSMKLKSLSKAVVLEGLAISEQTNDKVLALTQQLNSGIVHTLSGDFGKSDTLLNMAKTNADKVNNVEQRDGFYSKIHMYLGHLERARGNYKAAVLNYDDAEKFMKVALPAQKFEIQVSRLLASNELENFDDVDKKIPNILALAEKYRSEILDEKERTSFYDNERSIYEIAIENELRKKNITNAYNLAEFSRSRSLLDWIKKGAKVTNKDETTRIVFPDSSVPLKLDEIQKRMPAEVQILQYSLLNDRLLIWLISKDKFDLTEVKIDLQTFNEEVNKYQKLLRNNEDEQEQKILSKQLYQKLITPIFPKLDNSKYLAIIPDKFLFRVPFVALLDSDNKYFIEKFTSFYSPSANVLVFSSEKAREKNIAKKEKLLSVGNPNFDKELYKLQDLPNAEKEAEEIAKYYEKPELLIRENATKEKFLEKSKDANIIHFAGHYVVADGLPLESGLVMAKKEDKSTQLLTNLELIQRKFTNTKLIILSACDTGIEDYSDSEGLVGLSRTFLAADVPVVIGSQWKVDSEQSEFLMNRFHFYRFKKKSAMDSLKKAQLDLLMSEKNNLRNTHFWASFSLIGGHASF